MSERRSVDPIAMARAEAQAALESGDPHVIAETIVSIAFHDPDAAWVEQTCRQMASHDDANVRCLAMTCLGHVARIHHHLDAESLALLQRLIDDPVVGGYAQNALGDVEMFINRGRN